MLYVGSKEVHMGSIDVTFDIMDDEISTMAIASTYKIPSMTYLL